MNADIYIFKSALSEFCSIHGTLLLQCQRGKFCMCAEFLDTKLSEKSNFENFVYKLQKVQGLLKRKNSTKSFGIKFC